MRRVVVLFLTCGCLPARLAAQQSAPSITVVANPSFRPTGVLLPHLQFFLAVDTAAGGLVLQNLTVNPVTFTGSVRIEGARAGAREPEAAGFADSVRFGGDGQVALLVADGGSRAPIVVEPHGARNASGGRLSVSAANWPFGRVFIVTIDPADLYEHHWRSVGYGVRDRIRPDDRRGLAFLTDTSIAGTVVAIGMGRGTRGVLRADITSVVLSRRFGDEIGRERRSVGKVVLVIDPSHDAAGTAHAEIVFGVGATEDAAAQAASAAAEEGDAAPAVVVPRLETPSADVRLVFGQLLTAARPMLEWDRIAGGRSIPSGSDDVLAARPVDGWRGAEIALQLADPAALCGHYQLFRRPGAPEGVSPHQVAQRLGARGRSVVMDTATAGTARADDAGLILAGYACYRVVRDSAWLSAELPVLRAIGQREIGALGSGASPDAGDGALLADAFERLAELEDEAVAKWGLPAGPGSVWREAANRLGPMRPAAPAAAAAWRALTAAAAHIVRTSYGRPSDQADTNGLSIAAADAFIGRIAGGLFGVDEHLDRVDVAPRVDGIADDFTWRLEGWRLADDSLAVSYRPADRAATIRLGAFHRVRLALRFPWLTAESCVSVRRGPVPAEHPALIPLADGALFVDLRAHFDPAEVTVSAAPCGAGR